MGAQTLLAAVKW